MVENVNYFFKSLRDFNGVGAKFFSSLERLLKVNPNVLDLLFHIPYDFIDRRFYSSLSSVQVGKFATLKLKVVQHISPGKYRGRKSPYKIICANETGNISLVFFQIYDYTKQFLSVGREIVVSGKISLFDGELSINHPDYILPIEKIEEIPLMEPVYPLTYAVSNKMMVSLLNKVLENLPSIDEWQVDAAISFSDAFRILHTDFSNIKLREMAKERLVYDEILANQLLLSLLRKNFKKHKGVIVKSFGQFRSAVLKSLGFDLTNAQKRVISEILMDLQSPYKMLRLLQGDVGSGKTIVAILSLLEVVEVGGQGAFMVPTEILAEQHFNSFISILEKASLKDKVKVLLLTGKDKGKVKAHKLQQIKNGEVDVVIGTHALFQNSVEFKNMLLAVIDEQHKFGVHQRFELSNKGNGIDANLLAMTATPIPRTLALTSFGDMDLSVIDEMPPNRKMIETNLWSISKLDVIVNLIKSKLETNQIQKLYWVCPLVEESEKLDLSAVLERFELLKNEFGDSVGLVHGKMKPDEKELVMKEFANINGKIKILVATSVIEVGVNVPEATLMIIEHAERFGLSSLHQLRGRIGRGGDKSTCLLLHSDKLTMQARARLSIMKQTTDGFKIAEEDLKLRGAGELLGSRQSGEMEFKIADLSSNIDIFLAVQQDVKNIMEQDPLLLSNRGKNLRILLKLFDFKGQMNNLLAG